MYILETPNHTPQNLALPHAEIERPGRPPLLQIYSPTLPPLRHLQRQLKGKIRKLIVRPSTPFQLRIAQRLLITSDHRVVAKKDRAIPRLKIRAGPAFGSGEHATTHLCLRYLTHFLASSPKPKPTVLDLGCGSGILALAAAKWSANSIGWDLDPTAIQEAQRNARINRLNNKAKFSVTDALHSPLPDADLIVANLYDSLLLHLLPLLERHRKSHTSLIFSGILHGQENSIIRAARRFRWKLQRRGRLGRWHCLQFRA